MFSRSENFKTTASGFLKIDLKVKQLEEKKSSKGLLVIIPALFVAFKYALKNEDMNTDNVEQAIYFDYKKQVFLVEPKNRKLISKPTLLFYTTCKDAFQNFYKIFSKEYNISKKVTAEFMQSCMDKWLTDNSEQKIPVVS